MLSGIPAFLIKAGVFLIIPITAAGFLAEIFPFLDMINHFRPFLLAGAAVLLLVCGFRNYRRWRHAAAGAFAVNLIAAAVSFWQAGGAGSGAAIASEISETPKTILSLNVLYNNGDLDSIEQFLKSEQADIIVFQEFGRRHTPLLARLKKSYPYQKHCMLLPYCHLAILSKAPWRSITAQAKKTVQPPMISAEYETENGSRFRVINTHIAWPFAADKQQRDLEALAANIRKSDIPVIVAGDFNHTPWSWRLTKFAFETELKRHGTLTASWPAKLPTFLIDHVFSSPEVRIHETRTGPSLNSDHLPVISRFSLPRPKQKTVNSLAKH